MMKKLLCLSLDHICALQVVDPQPVRRTRNSAVRLPERLRNDYLWNDYLNLFTFINIFDCEQILHVRELFPGFDISQT
jgi:hypothetical protein